MKGDFINKINYLIESHKDIKSSLVAESKGISAIIEGVTSKEKIEKYLLSGFNNHLLYLHKKRCQNLMGYLKNGDR